MARLSKKEIGIVKVGVLNTRYCELLEKGETMPAHEISVAEAREILWIEDELHTRLLKYLGRNPYPPDRVEKKYPSNYMVSILKPTEPKPEPKSSVKIKFKITIISSIGSKTAEKNVYVNSRYEANLLANKMIKDLGLKKATYKIS